MVHNDNTIRSVNATHPLAAPSTSTLSPLRKAISLSTLFRSNSDAKSTMTQQRATPSPPLQSPGKVNAVPVEQQRIASSSSSSNGPSPSVVVTPPSTLRPLKRMRRRLSLRSPSMSPSVASSGISATTPTLGTPSSIASVSTPASSASASSFRGRPRSGSCRASLLGGSSGARILPFTLPTVNGTVDELDNGDTPKGNKTSFSARPTTHSVSPSLVPRRPITPAPLLMLDEEMNSLGITTGSAPSSDWHVVSPRTSLPPQRTSRSSFSASLSTTNGLSVASRLIERNGSQESFQCRGDDSVSNAGRPKIPTEMTRSASANTTTTGGGKSSQEAVIVPGSPLGWRRRPWALSLQLQSSSNPLQTELLPPASSITNHASLRSVIDSVRGLDEDKSRRSSRSTTQSSLDPRSHFSSSSEGDRTQSMIHIGMDESEVDEETCSASASSVTSPASTWSSSAFSFDTTLESPESRHSQRFSTVSASVLRRRSNTVSVIPMSDSTNSTHKRTQGNTSSATPKNLDAMPLPECEVSNICPASPPMHVRLRLTMPPTAKQAGVPSEDVMRMPMTASTLDFKEAICHSLTSRYGLSISPSQLGLFVVDLLNSPEQKPSNSPPLRRPSSPRSPSMLASAILGGNAVSEAGSTQEGASGYSFLRSRSRLRNSFASQQPLKATVSTTGPIFRQLDNDVALYQEGLQDDDAVIVRF